MKKAIGILVLILGYSILFPTPARASVESDIVEINTTFAGFKHAFETANTGALTSYMMSSENTSANLLNASQVSLSRKYNKLTHKSTYAVGDEGAYAVDTRMQTPMGVQDFTFLFAKENDQWKTSMLGSAFYGLAHYFDARAAAEAAPKKVDLKPTKLVVYQATNLKAKKPGTLYVWVKNQGTGLTDGKVTYKVTVKKSKGKKYTYSATENMTIYAGDTSSIELDLAKYVKATKDNKPGKKIITISITKYKSDYNTLLNKETTTANNTYGLTATLK